jgi:hypothetical protein
VEALDEDDIMRISDVEQALDSSVVSVLLSFPYLIIKPI